MENSVAGIRETDGIVGRRMRIVVRPGVGTIAILHLPLVQAAGAPSAGGQVASTPP